MKNTSKFLLLGITLICMGIMIGIYIGKSTNQNYIELTYDPTAYSDETNESEPRPQIIKININTANETDLTILPGIGESTAKQIVEYREQHGPYIRIEDLKNIKGISDTRLDAIRKYITVGG